MMHNFNIDSIAGNEQNTYTLYITTRGLYLVTVFPCLEGTAPHVAELSTQSRESEGYTGTLDTGRTAGLLSASS